MIGSLPLLPWAGLLARASSFCLNRLKNRDRRGGLSSGSSAVGAVGGEIAAGEVAPVGEVAGRLKRSSLTVTGLEVWRSNGEPLGSYLHYDC